MRTSIKSRLFGVFGTLVVGSTLMFAPLVAFAQPVRHTTVVNRQDVVWLRDTAQSSLYEIRLGRLALAKSNESDVRAFAIRLIRDHTKTLNDTRALASKYHIYLPATINREQAMNLRFLSRLNGERFERNLVRVATADHRTDIQKARVEAFFGRNREIRAFARTTIPVLIQHLVLAQKIR